VPSYFVNILLRVCGNRSSVIHSLLSTGLFLWVETCIDDIYGQPLRLLKYLVSYRSIKAGNISFVKGLGNFRNAAPFCEISYYRLLQIVMDRIHISF
jgi:hypothetical protein